MGVLSLDHSISLDVFRPLATHILSIEAIVYDGGKKIELFSSFCVCIDCNMYYMAKSPERQWIIPEKSPILTQNYLYDKLHSNYQNLA